MQAHPLNHSADHHRSRLLVLVAAAALLAAPAARAQDFDGDTVPDASDLDDDNDGVYDVSDWAPLDPDSCQDAEGDTCDDYDSPDDQGMNQEFWLEMTLKYNPSIRFLVAESDNAPLGGGDYYDGIYMYKDGVLTPLTAPVDH